MTPQGMQADRDPLADRASRLFAFLGKVQESKLRAVVDYTAYEREGQVRFFNTLSDSEHVRWGVPDDPDDNTRILEVDRLRDHDSPRVPALLRDCPTSLRRA